MPCKTAQLDVTHCKQMVE